MKHRLLFLLAVLLVAPLALVGFGAHVEAQDADPARPGQINAPQSAPMITPSPAQLPPFNMLDEARQHREQNQVRIRGRVVIRVSPGTRRTRTNMLGGIPRREMRGSYAEVEHEDCIQARNLVGVQPSADGRLMFFMDGGDVLLARLEDGCNARAFYAGFYTERSNDRRVCAGRNHLQSRAGLLCEVAEFSQIVAVSE